MLNSQSSPLNKSNLRAILRQRRRDLTQRQQRQAAYKLCQRVRALPVFLKAKHIAFYFSNDGEISPSVLMQLSLRMGKHCYIPKLRGKQLHFLDYKAGEALKANRFGIPEPLPSAKTRSAKALDIVFLPLVGFDHQGNRLGMGGGFYDRSFAFKGTAKNTRYKKPKPQLFGLAHQAQKVEQLPVEPWDIALNAIITERQTLRLKN